MEKGGCSTMSVRLYGEGWLLYDECRPIWKYAYSNAPFLHKTSHRGSQSHSNILKTIS